MPDIPFNTETHFPCGSLRAVPNDSEEMRRAVDWLVEQADVAESSMERARLLGFGGACAGILGEFEPARSMLDEAISIADEHDEVRALVVFRIRLADVLAISGDLATAIDLLYEQLDRCQQVEQLKSLQDFVHQHLGKALLEVGDIAGGIEHLEQALALRRHKDNSELIASTEQALSIARGIRQ